MPVRVLLVDDHAVVREGLKMMLGLDPEIEVIGQASNGREGIERVEQLHPQVVLMDLLMPEMDGVTAIGEIRSRFPDVECIALTSVLEDASVVGAVKAGAIGYMLKDNSVVEVCQAIHAAARGEVKLAPEAAARLMRELRPAPSHQELTERELEVLKLIAQGLSNADIAEKLTIGDKTVKSHVSRILSKLGVKSRTQVALHAWQTGLVTRGGR